MSTLFYAVCSCSTCLLGVRYHVKGYYFIAGLRGAETALTVVRRAVDGLEASAIVKGRDPIDNNMAKRGIQARC